MQVAIDFGLTNIDVVAMNDDGSMQYATVPSRHLVNPLEVARALAALDSHPADFGRIAVTGGQHRQLPDHIDGVPIVKVGELDAVGHGGLTLAQRSMPELREALIVSAGSGTAMIATRSGTARHVTGSAVGGGTLLGLCRLLIGTGDPRAIDAFALAGDSNKVDLTLIEATGGAIGKLPSDANAVNFGRIPSLESLELTPEDLAAGVANLVGQVIAVIAINAAGAERLRQIVVVGHTVDLSCMRRVLTTVAGYYGAAIMVPELPGFATAMGALLLG